MFAAQCCHWSCVASLLLLVGCATQSAEEDSHEAISWYCSGVYLEASGEFGDARDSFALAHDLDGAASEPAVAYARSVLATGDCDEALAVLEVAHRQAPDNVPVLIYLAELTFRRGMWREALSYNARLLRERPDLLQPAHHLASLLRRVDDATAILGVLREMAQSPRASKFLVTTVAELDQ